MDTITMNLIKEMSKYRSIDLSKDTNFVDNDQKYSIALCNIPVVKK